MEGGNQNEGTEGTAPVVHGHGTENWKRGMDQESRTDRGGNLQEGKEMKIWYAVIDREDDDWGTGSFDLEEAKRMCLETGNDEAYIAVIDDCENPVCIEEIHQDEF